MPKVKETVFAEQRRSEIAEWVRVNGQITVLEMSERYGVSSATIRADLTALEQMGLLHRTHGGAIRAGNRAGLEQTSAEKEAQHVREKQAIARQAAALIEPGDVIALDTGTTTRELATVLLETSGITVVTNDIRIATILSANERITLILLGGSVRPGFQCTLGAMAEDQLGQIYTDKAFIAANGMSATRGLSTPHLETGNVKRRLIANTGKVIALVDSSKVGNEALCRFAAISEVHTLITDSGISQSFLAEAGHAGIEVIVAG